MLSSVEVFEAAATIIIYPSTLQNYVTHLSMLRERNQSFSRPPMLSRARCLEQQNDLGQRARGESDWSLRSVFTNIAAPRMRVDTDAERPTRAIYVECLCSIFALTSSFPRSASISSSYCRA